MYAVGLIQKNGTVALSVDGQWVYKTLKNPEDIPPDDKTEVGFFRYHPLSEECFWVDPKIILEKAVFST